MRRIHRTIDIEAPLQRVWEMLNQPNNLPGVWPHLVAVSNIDPHEGGTSDFDWVFKMGGLHFNGHAFVETARPGEYVRYRNEGGIPSTFVWNYEAKTSGSTRLTVDVEYTIPTPVIGKIAEALVAKSNERDLDALLRNTKERLEYETARMRVARPIETSP
jgi:uncharacterized membrane protein